jgi:cell division protein FtsZ
VPNQRLLELVNKQVSVIEAFATADDVLRAGVQGITDLIVTPGLINLDFADVKSVMKGAGSALMGIGTAKGEDRAVRAAEIAVSSPLLEASIDGAFGVLLLVQGASDLGLHEIDEAARLVQEAVSPEANIIFGATIDDTLGDEVRITVIAAGFEGGQPNPKKYDRKAFSGIAALGVPAAAAPSAPVVAEAPSASTSWFTRSNSAEATAATEAKAEEVSTNTGIFNQVIADFDAEPAEAELAAVADRGGSNSSVGSNVIDGRFGDDLDIPDFLRDK